ncbi:DUF6415 family natural product biosynthesis protein [Streptomyces sp. NPDC047072]|uniref:DUF6415 family natural product biosynthesis protein n=1 Tax=Streptomyces sp. NPDC047072 TaxID=3154809 RepID=UPI0033D7A5BA
MRGTDPRVAAWLLLASSSSSAASAEWEKRGVTLLSVGVLFAAVRMPAALVHLAAGTTEPEGVASHLEATLHGGPAFVDERNAAFYFLLPPTVPRDWRIPGAMLLGSDYYIGVPRPDLTAATAGGGRSYWSVPMHSPHSLCSPAAVQQVAARAQLKVAQSPTAGMDAVACRARCEEALMATRELPQTLPARQRVEELTPLLRTDVETLLPHVDALIRFISNDGNRRAAEWAVSSARRELQKGAGGNDLTAADHLEGLAHVARALVALADLAALTATYPS